MNLISIDVVFKRFSLVSILRKLIFFALLQYYLNMLLMLFTCHAQNKWKDHHQHRALNLKFFLNALQNDYFNIIT